MAARRGRTNLQSMNSNGQDVRKGRVARFPGAIGTFMARDALSLAASFLELSSQDAVLLPVYNCQDVLKAFQRTNRVVFYDINQDLSIDPNHIAEKLRDRSIRMMMITNYFGFLQPCRMRIQELCRANGVSIIEDCAHSLLTEGSGETGDLSIYSYRKILPIPDGGGLQIRDQTKSPAIQFYPRLYSDALSALISVKALLNVHSDKFSRTRLTSHVQRVAPELVSRPMDAKTLPLSRFAERGMADLSFPEMIERRRNDFAYWQDLCRRLQKVQPIFQELPAEVCPLGFPVMIDNRASVESRAREHGINLRVHWRLDTELGSDCLVSHELTKKMLTLPLYPELSGREREALTTILLTC